MICFGPFDCSELRNLRDYCVHLGEVFRHISHQLQLAAPVKGAGTLSGKIVREEAAFTMARFPLRIGKIDVDRPYAAFLYHLAQKPARVAGSQLDIGQAALGEPRGRK